MLERLLSAGVRIGEPELKRVPTGFDAEAAPGDLLLRKGLAAWIDHDDPESIASNKLIERCLTDFKRLKPLVDLLSEM